LKRFCGDLFASQKSGSVGCTKLTVAQNLVQQARSDIFTRMNWYDRLPTINMAEKMVTAADARNRKSSPTQSLDQLSPVTRGLRLMPR
jgi:hypothetical protein